MKKILRRALAPVFIVLFVSACVVQRSPVTGEKRAYGYSWDQEVQIGEEADQQTQQEYGVYDDKQVQDYIKQIGQKVLSVSHLRREDTPQKYKETEFHYRVLDSPIVNAFALPGGYVYVTRGLLGHLENEAQLAVVLGHETGHVAARHASQRAFEQQVGQVALIGGAVAGEEFLGIPGGNILNLGSQAAQFLFLKYSRDDEREADKLGVEYAAMQHYEAADGAQFFTALKRMSQQSGQSIPDWQSTHPDPSERANRIPELARGWEEKGYEQNVEDADQYMKTIDNIIFGDNPREGFTRNGNYYHPGLAFQFPYPENWSVVNQRSLVAVVNPDQNALSVMEVDDSSSTAQVSVQNFLSQQGINTVSQSSASNNGLKGYEATATGQTQDGVQIKFYVYAVAYDGSIYRFLSYTSLDQFNTYINEFRQISNGFKQLTDQSILNIKPVRLQVTKADHTGPFQSFLPSSLPMNIKAEDIAIANQVELNETVREGQYIKIPIQ